MSRARVLVGGLVWAIPGAAIAKRSKAPPPPTAWTYTVTGTRTVTTKASGEGAPGMPPGLAGAQTDDIHWTATAGVVRQNPDGSLSELLRIDAPDTALHGRAFGLRRFDDGEVLRVERLLELADTGLAGWDPILVALSPARPEKVTTKTPGKRALQWTARLGTARFLRSNCPATWTVVDDGGAGVAGWQGRPVEHVRYEATCGLNGRSDVPGGGPVPLRGQGSLHGDVWWDAETHQVLRHDLSLERTVLSRWVTSEGRVEVAQDQTFAIRVDWNEATVAPAPVQPLATEDLMAVLPELVEKWSGCATNNAEQEVVLAAMGGGRLEVRAVGEPRGPALGVPDAGARPGFAAAPQLEATASPSVPLACWQAAADNTTLPAHDEAGVEFTFVLPWRDGQLGIPGVVDRERPPPGPLFVVVPIDLADDTATWLGVRR